MKIPLIGPLLQSIRSYRELLNSGAILSSADDGQIAVNLKGYISGDIQVCIVTKQGKQIHGLLADESLQRAGLKAMKVFRYKFASLKALPYFLISVINVAALSAYHLLIIQQIQSRTQTGLAEYLEPGNLPFLIIPLLSILFRKRIGGWILNIVFQSGFRAISLIKFLKVRFSR